MDHFNSLKTLTEPISNQTDVALQITKQLFQTEFKDTNMIYSPISIHMILSLLATTARDDPQFLKFLKLKSIDDLNSLAFNLVSHVLADTPHKGGPRLNFTNGLWVDQSTPLQESFKETALNSYKAAIEHVDIKSDPEKVRAEVNAWVEKETKGLIPEILSPGSVSSMTNLIFANALYFKATWDDVYFFESRTKKREFHLLNGDLVKGVPFMTGNHCHSVGAFDDFKILRLPYRDIGNDDLFESDDDLSGSSSIRTKYTYDPRDFSMCLLLPNETDGLPALVERLCSNSSFLNEHLKKLSYVRMKKLLIPKFKISCCFEASDVVRKLGLGCDSMEIVHKAVIEVDENGTTAAAATAGHLEMSMGEPSLPQNIEEFVADHPFMFLIRESITGTVLFMGQVLNPLAD